MEQTAKSVFAPKRNGTLRICVEYRKLNAVANRSPNPISRKDACLSSLGEPAILSALNTNSGHWQIKIVELDRDKTTFMSHHGLHRFIHMPPGLRNVPGTFQRTIYIALAAVK